MLSSSEVSLPGRDRWIHLEYIQYLGNAQGLQDRWIQGRTVTLESHFVVESFVNLRHPSS